MKKSILNLLSIVLIAIFVLTMLPTVVKAADGDLEGVILEKDSGNGDKVIYLKGMEATEFKYAFGTSADPTGAAYITAVTDSNNEYVAVLESSDTTSTHLFVLVESTTYVVELSSLKSIKETEISELEKLTEIIDVTTDEVQTKVTNNDGTVVTTTTGKIVVKEDGTHKYELIEIVDKNNTITTPNEKAVELYEKISGLKDLTKMYDKVSSYITIRDNYKTLKDNATWKDAKNNEILQPEDSQNDEKFIVLIQKVENGTVVKDDIQIMTCKRQDDADVEVTEKQETKVVEKKSELPVTGENIALYIALAVIILAIIVLVIKMIKSKANNNETK